MPSGSDAALLARILPCAGLPGHRYRQTRVDFRRGAAIAKGGLPGGGTRARLRSA
jgi:hypothetical protein